ncbi:MAG: hypothetical protein ACKOE3_03595, partial [Betaproteobacteria bacterium]
MNPLLQRLQPYPFERLRALTAGVTANPALRPISLGIGEPKHPTPVLVEDVLLGGGVTVSNITFNGVPSPVGAQPGSASFTQDGD